MTNLSDTFKYISHFRHAGHQVGRKVGDMLEVLTYAAIARDDEMLARLQVEPKLHGFSGAGHKVEFILLSTTNFDEQNNPQVINGGEITDPSEVISFIECKKVGVEQTVNGRFKKMFPKNGNNKGYKVLFDNTFPISFAPRGGERHTYSVTFTPNRKVRITKAEDTNFLFEENLVDEGRIIFTLCTNGLSEIIGNNRSLRDYEPTLAHCRILEIISISDAGVIALLNDCLSGPQTPEKAKQSSFVALDVRKNRFNSFDKREPETEMVSVLVLTEFSHWEEKSQNMIKSCIDKNFVVSDDIIVEAFEAFEDHFGESFYDKITKENFENDADVRRIAFEIVNQHDGKIFLDIKDQTYKKFLVRDNLFITL
ncbi:hypothetical protein C9I43_00340 (plasmid) [Shewanella morhuae]|uniref:Uncharacterized protein n=1 Tax=Shewanella morhuae TaxID=365591 RepID=A0ABX5HYH9_9GAMM|nr:hypothetical protein [Shewanella morhuae]PTA51825.1 hypothetical protein C9I43_00340 [Shewanella morhuae]